MATHTISVDEKTHRLARARAAELDTPLLELLNQYLESLADAVEDDAVQERTSVERESEEALAWRRRKLDEVLADFDRRGVGVHASERLAREELYEEAMSRFSALRR